MTSLQKRVITRNAPKPTLLRGIDESTIQPGRIRIHSTSTPQLLVGSRYYTYVQQRIVNTDSADASKNLDVKLLSTKEFVPTGSAWQLDPSAIHSVYPPQGHADYANVLPHVLFDNLQLPWMIKETTTTIPPVTIPWLGLLVFTEDELTPDATQIDQLNSKLQTTLKPSPTLSYSLTTKQLRNLDRNINMPMPEGSLASIAPSDSAMQVIFLQGKLFDSLFKTAPNGRAPDLSSFFYMSHVRTLNSHGVANSNTTGTASYSVAVSPRSGPLDISQPTVVHAHLVSLVGGSKSLRSPTPPAKFGPNGSFGMVGLVSLHSWSYTCLPDANLSVKATFDQLGQSIQTLRRDDGILGPPLKSSNPSKPNQYNNKTNDWVKQRMLAGYNILRHRLSTGETTIAFHRGILTPVKPDSIDFPPSDFGTDLAIVNRDVGYTDITYLLAWELGRTISLADRAFSSALARLRGQIHEEALSKAKTSVYSKIGFVSAEDTYRGLPDTMRNLSTTSKLTRLQVNASNRWFQPTQGNNTRAFVSFLNPNIQLEYVDCLKSWKDPSFARSSKDDLFKSIKRDSSNPVELYNEENSPLSTDYAALLAWVMDKWFLYDLPLVHLIPDPSFVPKESIRTFYVDHNWFKVFVDGALSLCHHFNDTDDVRETIKASLSTYLKTNLKNGYPPQIPKWGFLLRSQIVTTFPDLRISAPRSSPSDSRPEVIRMEKIDTDLLLVLFDREPADGFPEGIQIHPPQHQLSFSLEGINEPPTDEWTITWKKVFQNLTIDQDYERNLIKPLKLFIKDSGDTVFYPTSRMLNPALYASYAADAMGWAGNPSTNRPGKTPALVGAQLVTTVPVLTLLPPSSYRSPRGGPGSPPSLSTTRPRPTKKKSRKVDILKPWERIPAYPGSNNPPPKYQDPAPAFNGDILIEATRRVTLPDSNPSNSDRVIISRGLVSQEPSAPDRSMIGALDSEPQLVLNIYNLRRRNFTGSNQYTDTYVWQTGAIALLPLELGFTTDLNISLRSIATTVDQWYLQRVEIQIPVGPDSILRDLTKAFTNPEKNSLGDWKHRPSKTDIVLPKARAQNQANSGRWIYATSFIKAGTGGTNALKVIITPNYSYGGPSDASWDIYKFKDLSFVLQDVQLNFNGATNNISPPAYTYTVYMLETYERAPLRNGQATSKSASQKISVLVKGIDVRNPMT